MRGKPIHIDHPRDSYCRLGGLHNQYFDIAQEEYVKCLKVGNIDDSNMHDGEKSELSYRSKSHSIKAIIFSALCIEAAINNYAGTYLGDSYTENHLHKLDVVSKWVVIPKLVCGQSIDKSGPAFGALKNLIKARNKLVHNKSKEFDVSAPSLIKDLDKSDSDFENDFTCSLKALYLLCMEMDFVLGQTHNPIGTLDKAFNLMLEIPAPVKPIFDECKKITLKLYS